MSGSPGQLSNNSATVSVSAADIVSASGSSSAFGTFGTSVESSISDHMPSQEGDTLSSRTSSALVSDSLTSALAPGGDLSSALAPSGDLNSALAASGINASMNQVLAYAQSATSVMSSSDLSSSSKSELDHSNVCKVSCHCFLSTVCTLGCLLFMIRLILVSCSSKLSVCVQVHTCVHM